MGLMCTVMRGDGRLRGGVLFHKKDPVSEFPQEKTCFFFKLSSFYFPFLFFLSLKFMFMFKFNKYHCRCRLDQIWFGLRSITT